MSSSGNSDAHSKCKKILEGKNKGKRCRNKATADGLCKIHCTGGASSALVQRSFTSDKVGLALYKELEEFLNKSQTSQQTENPESQTNRDSASVSLQDASHPQSQETSTKTRGPRPKRTRQSRSRTRRVSPSVSSRDVEGSVSPVASSYRSVSPLGGTFENDSESSSEDLNKKRKPMKGRSRTDYTDAGIDPDITHYITMLGASTVVETIESSTPRLKGFHDELFANPQWRKSFTDVVDKYMKDHAEKLTPEMILAGTTIFIGLKVANNNRGKVNDNPVARGPLPNINTNDNDTIYDD